MALCYEEHVLRAERLLVLDGLLPGGELRALEQLLVVVVCIDGSRLCHVATLITDTNEASKL